MSYIKSLFNKNFLEYASYVIRDRAIPELEDGLKPVQRRIMHTLFEMDDGKFHKVNNVVGQCMKFHPHGDASIGSALVTLANKNLFIDKQGNFGNIYTGDSAAASRYIECRSTAFAKDVFFNPAITKYEDSYDGRSQEPVAFRAKLPVVLIIGAEGIAVGMSTKILPHNAKEVIEAEKACLLGKPFKLYPDFPTAGEMDVSEYEDGNGRVLVRAKMDTSDPKKIVIREIPFGCTTESLINSVENAAKIGRIKIASINDFTTSSVEIEIKLQRGVYAQEVIDALYAFTECEQSISCNLLVIKDNLPVQMTTTSIIKEHSKQLLKVLKDELELEKAQLLERLHMRTLERIFVEERIYKKIETMKTAETVVKAVLAGFVPFKAELIREVTPDDVDKLLKIPIRRISLYDINKNRQEVQEINERIKQINYHLKHLTEYALNCLDNLLGKIDPALTVRKTVISKFGKIDVKEAAKRDVPLRYDSNSGYLGISVSTGDELLTVSPYDRIMVMRRSGIYTVMDVPDKLFVDKGIWHCSFAEKERLSKYTFTIIFKDKKTGYPYIKRCKIEQFILNRDYLIVPDDSEVLFITTKEKGSILVEYEPRPRIKTNSETFKIQEYDVKGLKTLGIRLTPRVVLSASLEVAPAKTTTAKAATEKPATKSVATKPAATKSATEKAATVKPTAKPTAKSTTAKAATVKPTAKPTAKSTTAKAATVKPTAKPTAKATIEKAATEKPATKSVATKKATKKK